MIQPFSSLSFSGRHEEISSAKQENEDILIAAQLQQTLAGLDEHLEGRKVCYSEVQKKEA